MLLLNRIFHKTKPFALAVGLAMVAVVSACTVQPLYKAASDGMGQVNVSSPIRNKLASIVIDQPSDRFNQMVRNRLIFLLYGGQPQPSETSYHLTLNTSFVVRSAVQVDIGDTTDRTGRASAGSVAGNANYVLKDIQEKVLAKHRRSVAASFDRPRQEYANLQAEENAKKRAAEELAQQIYLSLAQDVSKL